MNAIISDAGQVRSSCMCACEIGRHRGRGLEMYGTVARVREGEQGAECQDNPELMIGGVWHTEPSEKEGWRDHVTNAAHLELCPVLSFDSAVELCQYVATKLREERRHGFRRHLRPELMGVTEQGHECTSRSIHMQDASG